MRLSRFTDIGLRALMYVGASEGRVSAREVADSFNVSKDHVVKSLQALVAIGALSSTVGRNGGFEMHADPRSLRIGRVIRKLEPSLALAECFGPDSGCPLTASCELAEALGQAQTAFFDVLDRYTLADLLESNHQGLVQIMFASAGA